MAAQTGARGEAPFTEKSFYLGEFRGRTLAIAARGEALRDPKPIASVLAELEANGTDVVLVSDDAAALSGVSGTPVLESAAPGLEGRTWRALRYAPRVGIQVAAGALAERCHAVALRLGVTKLVWLDPQGGLARPDGGRLSFLDLDDLAQGGQVAATHPERSGFLQEIERALAAGLPAINLCTPGGLADELFTYAGSGTLFTPGGYVDVRRLTLDDFSAAHALAMRGVEEGYLAPRASEQQDAIFEHGFGAFVEGRHLAGIGALLRHGDVGEIASLYTLTRFLGEGIGRHLVRALCERASVRGDRFVFACTTTARVVGFFECNGFARVSPDSLPPEKWRGYDEERRARLVCLRHDSV